jgi:hypothetical protein
VQQGVTLAQDRGVLGSSHDSASAHPFVTNRFGIFETLEAYDVLADAADIGRVEARPVSSLI